MKRKKTKRTTSEEAFRQAAESRLGLDFDYKQIKDRLDVDEMAHRAAHRTVRRGAIRSAQTPASGMPMPAYRRPAVAVFLTAFLLCATIGGGGMMIAHLAQEPAPLPVDTQEGQVGTDFSTEYPIFTGTDCPIEDPYFLENDTLTWEGVTYVRTTVLLSAEQVEDKLGEVIPAKPQAGAEHPDRFHDNKAVATALTSVTSFFLVADCDKDLCVAVQIGDGFALYMVPDAKDTHT